MSKCKYDGCHSRFFSAADRIEHERTCGFGPKPIPHAEPCPHCAAKDAEIAALKERLAEVQRLHEGVWSCENAADTARYFDEGLRRILRGEGE